MAENESSIVNSNQCHLCTPSHLRFIHSIDPLHDSPGYYMKIITWQFIISLLDVFVLSMQCALAYVHQASYGSIQHYVQPLQKRDFIPHSIVLINSEFQFFFLPASEKMCLCCSKMSEIFSLTLNSMLNNQLNVTKLK